MGDPRADVLDVSEVIGRVLAREGILTRWIALAGEEVEAARVAIDVEILGEVRTVPPRAAPFALPGRDVEPARGTS